MGKSKETVVNNTSQTAQYTPTPEEVELNKLNLAQAKEFDPQQRQINRQAGDVVSNLLTGNTEGLPGFLRTLARGVDPSVTQGLVDQSLRDVNTQLAASGAGTFLESGPAQSIGARTAGDIRLASEESNLNRLLNLLNIGVGGQAQIQQPILATSANLGSRLAGLRSMSGTSTGTQTSYGMNPFIKSFQSAAGTTFGSPNFMAGPVGFGK